MKVINKYWIYFLFIILTIISVKGVVFNIFWTTFNFPDNFWYAKTIELMKLSLINWTPFYIPEWMFFINSDIKLYFVSPLWQSISVFIGFLWINSTTAINLIIIWNIFLSLLFSYKLLYYISKTKSISFMWAVIFWCSSLVLYGTWFNLAGTFFIPLILLLLLKNYSLFIIGIIITLAFLCNTYNIIIVWVIILSFLLCTNNWYKKSLQIVITVLISLSISYLIYQIPFLFLQNYWISNHLQNLLKSWNLSQSIDITRLILPNNDNLLNSFQLDLYNNYIWNNYSYFRYSYYLSVPVLVLLALAISRNSIVKKNKYKNLWYYLTGISLILFLWDRFIINWFDLWINNIMYYISSIPWWEVFRKSSYMFYSLCLWVSIILVVTFSSDTKFKNFHIFWYIIWIIIFFSNLSPYQDKKFEVLNKSAYLDNISNWSSFITLPNSWYNNWESQYFLLKYNKDFRVIENWNTTLSTYTKSIPELNQDWNNIIFNKPIKQSYDCLTSKSDYVILFKKYSYNFFWFANRGKLYWNTKEKLLKCSNISLIYSNDDIELYKNNYVSSF